MIPVLRMRMTTMKNGSLVMTFVMDESESSELEHAKGTWHWQTDQILRHVAVSHRRVDVASSKRFFAAESESAWLGCRESFADTVTAKAPGTATAWCVVLERDMQAPHHGRGAEWYLERVENDALPAQVDVLDTSGRFVRTRPERSLRLQLRNETLAITVGDSMAFLVFRCADQGCGRTACRSGCAASSRRRCALTRIPSRHRRHRPAPPWRVLCQGP